MEKRRYYDLVSDGKRNIDLILDTDALVNIRNIYSSDNLRPGWENELIQLIQCKFVDGGHRFTAQLGALRQSRKTLSTAVKTLNQNIQFVDTLSWLTGSFVSPEVAAPLVAAGICQSFSNQSDVLRASLLVPEEWLQPSSVNEEVYVYLMSVARRTKDLLRKNIVLCRRHLRLISALIAVTERLARSGMSFFCSVGWEHRRWFLFHGARPPKSTEPAVVSLFTGACSDSLLAY